MLKIFLLDRVSNAFITFLFIFLYLVSLLTPCAAAAIDSLPMHNLNTTPSNHSVTNFADKYVGNTLYQKAKLAEKNKQYSAALTLYLQFNDSTRNDKDRIEGLYGLIRVYQQLNRGADAFNVIRRLEEISVSISDNRSLIRNYRTLAIAYQSIGKNEISRDYYAVAIETARQEADEILLADLLNEQAYADTLVSDIESAIRTFEESKSLYKKNNITQGIINTTLNQIHAEILLDNKEKTNALLLSLKKYFPNKIVPDRTPSQLIRLGILYRAAQIKFRFAGSYRRKSYLLYSQAEQIAETSNDKISLSYVKGYMAQMYADEGKYDEAITLTHIALKIAEDQEALLLQFKWYLQLARAYGASKQFNLSGSAYANVLDILQKIGLKPFTIMGKNFVQDIEPVFKEYLNVLFLNTLKKTVTGNINEFSEIFKLMHLFRIYEVMAYCDSACKVTPRKQPLKIEKGKILIASFVFRDRVTTLAMLEGGVKYYSVNVEEKVFRRKLQDFNNHSVQFYQWMVKPFSKFMSDTTEIVFLQNNMIGYFPFHALRNKNNYLIEGYTISLASDIYDVSFSTSIEPENFNSELMIQRDVNSQNFRQNVNRNALLKVPFTLNFNAGGSPKMKSKFIDDFIVNLKKVKNYSLAYRLSIIDLINKGEIRKKPDWYGYQLVDQSSNLF